MIKDNEEKINVKTGFDYSWKYLHKNKTVLKGLSKEKQTLIYKKIMAFNKISSLLVRCIDFIETIDKTKDIENYNKWVNYYETNLNAKIMLIEDLHKLGIELSEFSIITGQINIYDYIPDF